ncbi:MAG: DUF3795 domain-containing protein [Clostridia bacterium]|jgi:hypothetical protein
MEGMKHELLGPCGMNCRLCIAYQRKVKPCGGCMSAPADKQSQCRNCLIKKCEAILKEGSSGFCYSCGEYPCKRIMDLDIRYRTRYHMSMTDNLMHIKEHGSKEFLLREDKRWRCKKCGGIISVHTAKCPNCSAPFDFEEDLYVRSGDNDE